MSEPSAVTPTAPPGVLVDTDVCSRVVLPGMVRGKRHPEYAAWVNTLLGYRLAISVQTRVELLAWPLLRGWGATRTTELHTYLRRALVLQVTDDVQRGYAELTARLNNSGHGLGQKHHAADRWVAATALANSVPLATMDGIFKNVPGLNLLTP